jgi:hypothetical protein
MHIVLGFTAFIVLITLLDTHSEQQRTRRKLGSGAAMTGGYSPRTRTWWPPRMLRNAAVLEMVAEAKDRVRAQVLGTAAEGHQQANDSPEQHVEPRAQPEHA